MYASRQDLDEAIGLARRFAPNHGAMRVMSSTNRWYAVVSGPVSVQSPEQFRPKLAESWGDTPKDIFLSKGQTLVQQVWRTPRSPILASASLYREAPPTASADGLEISLEAQSKTLIAHVRASGRDVAAVTFGRDFDELAASIVRLDPHSPSPQVVVTHFTGGAHCCTMTRVATLTEGRWQIVDAGVLDGGGYEIVDITDAGSAELVFPDNSFNYAFSSYAESLAPTKIFRLVNNQLKDVTRDDEYQRFLRQIMLADQGLATPDMWSNNGFLAGWVAEKALLGEEVEAWSQLMRSYDREFDGSFIECLNTIPYEPLAKFD